MEPKFNTSFIPKESLKDAPVRQKKDKTPSGAYGLGFLITMLMALMALVGTVGVLFYAQLVKAGIAEKQNILVESYGQLDSDVVAELRAFDARLRAAEELAEQHVVFSHFFTLLEQYTLRRGVRYTSMNFAFSDGTPQVSLSGEASVLSNVALQMDAFRDSGAFEDVTLSSVRRGGDDSVATFSLVLRFSEDKILFLAQGGGVGVNSGAGNAATVPTIEGVPLVEGEGGSVAGSQDVPNTEGEISVANEEMPMPEIQGNTNTETAPETPTIPEIAQPSIPAPVVPGVAPGVPLIPLQ